MADRQVAEVRHGRPSGYEISAERLTGCLPIRRKNGEGRLRVNTFEKPYYFDFPLLAVRRESDQAVGRPSEAAMAQVSAEGSTPRTDDNIFRQRR